MRLIQLVRVATLLAVLPAASMLGDTKAEGAGLTRCLPPNNCSAITTCCIFPHDCVMDLSLALTDLQSDFYDSQANRDAAAASAVKSGYSPDGVHAAEALVGHFNDFLKNVLGQVWKKAAHEPNDPECQDAIDTPSIDWQTNDSDCSICPVKPAAPGAAPKFGDSSDCDPMPGKSPGDIADLWDQNSSPGEHNPSTGDQADMTSNVGKENTCSELVDAQIAHEKDHVARCLAAKASGGSLHGLSAHANDERDAYAKQSQSLRDARDQAHARCTAIRKLDKSTFDNAAAKAAAFSAFGSNPTP